MSSLKKRGVFAVCILIFALSGCSPVTWSTVLKPDSYVTAEPATQNRALTNLVVKHWYVMRADTMADSPLIYPVAILEILTPLVPPAKMVKISVYLNNVSDYEVMAIYNILNANRLYLDGTYWDVYYMGDRVSQWFTLGENRYALDLVHRHTTVKKALDQIIRTLKIPASADSAKTYKEAFGEPYPKF